MKTCCSLHPFKSNLCRQCWRREREQQYHCTWPNCIRPVFTLTLCRTHYRQINVDCAWPDCTRPSYCRQVCAHHYRKREFPPVIQCCECEKPMYMHGKCFYHFTFRNCLECDRKVFSKQLCRRHYMRQYRSQRLSVNGPTTSSENKADTTHIVPETINQSPESHSSLEHSVIST
jgi:hypothetical protein